MEPPPDPRENVWVKAEPSDPKVFEMAKVVGVEGRFHLVLSADRQRRLVVVSGRERWETGQTVPTDEKDVVLYWRDVPAPALGDVRLRVTDQVTGKPVPEFKVGSFNYVRTAESDDGTIFHLAEQRADRYVVIYFYPKDFTRG